MRAPSKRNPNLDLVAVESARPPPPEHDDLVGPRPSWWWTGKAPSRAAECPGLDDGGVLRALPMPDLRTCTRGEVLDYFDNGWTLNEVLLSGLQGDAAFRRPPYHRLRHPLIFYYAHPAAFYVNKLRLAGLLDDALDEELETLFQTGVDEMSWDDLSQSEEDWPAVRVVTEYRRQAYRLVRGLIETHAALEEGHPPITMEHPLWALFISLEHERIHLELTSVLVRELPNALVTRPAAWPPVHPSADRPSEPAPRQAIDYPANAFLSSGGGTFVVGKPRDWPSFGWDNEYGERHAHVRRFRATKHLVSNGEFCEFVRGGGYHDARYWTDEGWKWRSFRNAKWPAFWVAEGPAGLHRYKLRTVFDVVDMPWSWPVDVNFHEARAYCKWRAERDGSALPYRLLTEGEHHALRDPVVETPSGHAPATRANHALVHGSQGPVDAFSPTARGFHDVFGNVWQWCEDHFHPLPGFAVHPHYDDFSSPCFDGKHQMILGGSFVSSGDEASTWARFHFRAHFVQHAGFRVVVSDNGDGGCDAVRLDTSASSANVYETDELRDQYLMLHYGDRASAMPYAFGPHDAVDFPRRCAELVIELCKRHDVVGGRALDVGCAVGGASFALARGFEQVLGVDLSASFIDAASSLARDGELQFRRRDEGELGADVVATIDPAIDRGRVSFRQADACSLPAELVGFDAVLLANLLCRLPSPRACLERMAGARGIVRPGGLLVVTSPYTWMESFTPKDVWLGGMIRGGHEVRSIDGLHALLDQHFELVDSRDMPLVIREHARKFQYIVAHATAWRRRAVPRPTQADEGSGSMTTRTPRESTSSSRAASSSSAPRATIHPA